MAKKSAEQKGDGRSILPIKPGMTFVNIGMAVGLAVLLTIIMKTLAPILKPFFIALFLSYLLYPIIEYLAKRKVPKFLAYLLVFLLIFGLFYVLGAIITVQVNEFIDNLDTYKGRLADLFTQFAAFLQRYSILERLGFDSGLMDFREFSPLEKLQELILSKLDLSKITGYIGSSLGSFLDVVVNILVVAFFMIFLLLEIDRLPARIKYAYGEDSDLIIEIVEEVDRSVRKYLMVKTMVSLITGITYTIVLWIAGVDFFLLWGLLAFLLNYIPYIGSYVATVLPVLVALIILSPLSVLIVLIILLAIQMIMGNIVEPKLLGRELNLSPVVVLISLAFWGWLWGLTGMFLSIPITATIKIVMEYIPETQNVARLMSDVVEVPSVEEIERKTEKFTMVLKKVKKIREMKGVKKEGEEKGKGED
ncbi:MAG: AI-2E family transporter [Deltaproteobacteria bacterium]|uniref:AI-2E family transporter n=1 Tax=Candidatus Zymogenus saltonus TaxID=2844893 RepID=A0A9D8KDN7_9DELT|nr:AI-2E family transporter [Candidatus Zymogenus saltonus]